MKNVLLFSIGSLAFVLLLPVAVDLALWAHHLASYQGTCGPHPTDISAHPCSYATYSGEFWGGFNLFGLLVLDMGILFVGVASVCTFWGLVCMVKLAVPRDRAKVA